MAERYGTSVTPVREALQMLSQEGFVTPRPHAGFYVTQVTLKELRDVLEMREILKVASVERAAVWITDEQIEGLRTRDVNVARRVMRDEVNETREITLDHAVQKDGAAWYVGTRTD